MKCCSLDIGTMEKVPVMVEGKNLHWAILCGVIVGKISDKTEDKSRSCTSSHFVNYPNQDLITKRELIINNTATYTIDKHWNDDRNSWCLCELGELGRDLEYTYVIVKHGGKSGKYEVWPLLDVLRSNAQISKPGSGNPRWLSGKRYVLLEPKGAAKVVSNYVNCSKPNLECDVSFCIFNCY